MRRKFLPVSSEHWIRKSCVKEAFIRGYGDTIDGVPLSTIVLRFNNNTEYEFHPIRDADAQKELYKILNDLEADECQ